MEKDGDYPFCFGGFLYLYLLYVWEPLSTTLGDERKKIGMGHREGWNPPPVWGVCGYSFLGISCVGSWLSRGDSILLFVLCGPGSVRGCESVSAILLCYIAFGLVPVGRHWWARLFWLVTGTNARRCSFRCVYASWLGHFWSLFLVLFCFYVFFLISESLLFLSQQTSCLSPQPSDLQPETVRKRVVWHVMQNHALIWIHMLRSWTCSFSQIWWQWCSHCCSRCWWPHYGWQYEEHDP